MTKTFCNPWTTTGYAPVTFDLYTYFNQLSSHSWSSIFRHPLAQVVAHAPAGWKSSKSRRTLFASRSRQENAEQTRISRRGASLFGFRLTGSRLFTGLIIHFLTSVGCLRKTLRRLYYIVSKQTILNVLQEHKSVMDFHPCKVFHNAYQLDERHQRH